MERESTARERNSKFDLSVKGFLPASMLDWPGRMCTTIFLGRCNFRCPYCHNPELVLEPDSYENIPVVEILSYIKERKDWIDSVVITGGEPTLSRGLRDLIVLLKESGFYVKLDTNGSKPSILKQLLQEKLVDFIAMDLKVDFEEYPKAVRAPVDINAIIESVKLIIESAPEYEFRTTLVPGIITPENLESLARRVSGMGASKLVFQQFRSENTLDEEFRKLKPYSHKEIEEMVNIASKYLEVEVRGI